MLRWLIALPIVLLCSATNWDTTSDWEKCLKPGCEYEKWYYEKHIGKLQCLTNGTAITCVAKAKKRPPRPLPPSKLEQRLLDLEDQLIELEIELPRR